MRRVGKCLRVGVLEGQERTQPERGTPQGSGLSSLLGNVYLHYTLDVWFEREVKPRLEGGAVRVRYCDDFVIGLERREDAQRVAAVLGKRMERFGLRLHPEKTRLVAFERPTARQRGGKGPGTFEFLGFTMYWRRTRGGHWQMGCKTRGKGLRRFIETVGEWCRRHRHLPVRVQHAALTRRLAGHINYFGVNGNSPSLARVVRATQRGLAQMAAPSQSENPSHMGAVQEDAGPLPAASSASGGADMGSVATRHISGGAGWWQSPCPVLVRASGEQSPGATRPGRTKDGGVSRLSKDREP